jgi:fumarate hydratase subunit alpha
MPVPIRRVPFAQIVQAVRDLFIDACHNLPNDVLAAIQSALQQEESPTGKHILQLMLQNAELAPREMLPLCQDTGVAVVFVDQGNRVLVEPPDHRPDASLADAVAEGVRAGYTEGYLRKSMVDDPVFKRANTNDNTPPVIHHRFVPGDKLTISVLPKGGGCENKSQFAMLTPAQGEQGVKDFIVSVVEKAGADACPPYVVGVGIGGDFEKACILSKHALLRPLGQPHPDPQYAALEHELLQRINNLGVGPQGLGGRITALGVRIEACPCHIASLPVAVNIECHAHRHKSATI